ncbi:hypothetical protein RAH41_08600 [Gottfriedia acidiceleris]|uniref:hypothetical protein n=1 Tax=Gottfriedia acidiceleris TaxID=371036 RepID=UPI002F262F18
MVNKLEELNERNALNHRNIVKYVKHVFDELDLKVKRFREETAIKAAHHAKPDLEEEKLFYNNIHHMKTLLIDVLERTTEDLEHMGDKNWNKNFKDGVNA